MKKRVCFLFGAGADHNYNEKIPMGGRFASILLLNSEKGYNKIIAEYYKERLAMRKRIATVIEKEWLPTEYNPAQIDKHSLYKASLRKKYALTGINKKEIDQAIKTAKEKIEDTIAECPNYINQIDGRMHTLIRPKSYGQTSFWAVIQLYTRAYLCICQSIFEDTVPIADLLKDCSSISDHFDTLIELSENSYYHVIKSMKARLEDVTVVTANYTPLAEKVIGLDQSKIAYPHGKIGWFESPYRLEVYDSADKNDREKINTELVFPYIFLQSGVKPIVDPKQIDEYAKTHRFISETDILVICGYGINEDDNHLNSLLRDRVKHGYKTLIIDYQAGPEYKKEEKVKKEILKKMRIDDAMGIQLYIEIIKKSKKEIENKEFEAILKKYLIGS